MHKSIIIIWLTVISIGFGQTKKNDFVFGSRYKKGGYSEDDTLVTKLGNFFFSKIKKKFTYFVKYWEYILS